MTRIAILGAGSWGTGLAVLLGSHGHAVRLWGRDAQALAAMRRDRENTRYLPGISLPAGVEPEADLARAVADVEQVWLVVPSQGLRAFLCDLQPCLPAGVGLVSASKGLERGTGKRLSEMVGEQLGLSHPFAVFSGPTFAREVAQGLPGAATVACVDECFAHEVAGVAHGPTFRAYTTSDVIGVELGGALKNVLAIAAGVADGFHFGANTRAALITRGLAEMMRLGDALGARRETFMGLAGLGDLVLTATDDQSRNRRFGLALAQGLSVEAALRQIGQAVEGLQAAAEGWRLAQREGVDMPIIEAVNRVAFEGLSPRVAVTGLLSREPRAETA